MTRESGFDVTAFKSHIDDIYRDRPINESTGVDLLSQAFPRVVAKPAAPASVAPVVAPPVNAAPAEITTVAKDASADPLTIAIDRIKDVVVEDVLVRIKAADDRAAKELKDQEALARNPAEMRKLFPQLLKDVPHRDPDHIDLNEIESGLKLKNLSQLEKNFLVVLKRGYDQFIKSPKSKIALDGDSLLGDQKGVSADSLAMIDKALNRDINENPWLAWRCLHDGLLAGGSFSLLALYSVGAGNVKETAKVALVMGAAGVALGVGQTLLYKAVGWENKMYNGIETNYNSFLEELKTPAPILTYGPAAGVDAPHTRISINPWR